jgi:hypothetical protein
VVKSVIYILKTRVPGQYFLGHKPLVWHNTETVRAESTAEVEQSYSVSCFIALLSNDDNKEPSLKMKINNQKLLVSNSSLLLCY